jgi:hypothetical protein
MVKGSALLAAAAAGAGPALTAAATGGPYQSFLLHAATPIDALDAEENFFPLLGVADLDLDGTPDVFGFKTLATGTGMLEVHVLRGADGYSTFVLQTGTPIAVSDAGRNYVFGVGAVAVNGLLGAPDVYGLKVGSTRMGRLEVHVLDGASNYQSFRLRQLDTPIAASDFLNHFSPSFGLADLNGDGILDLFLFKVANTGTGTLEVHVLDGATDYRTFLLQTGTPIGATDAEANFRNFAVGDLSGAGVPDVFAFKVQSTGTGMLEAHVLDGASDFQSFALQTGTAIGEEDAAGNFTFGVGDLNADGLADVYGFKFFGAATGQLEVHVLDGAPSTVSASRPADARPAVGRVRHPVRPMTVRSVLRRA